MIIRSNGLGIVLPSPIWGQIHEGLEKDVNFRWTYKGSLYSYVPLTPGQRSTLSFKLTQEKADELIRFMADTLQYRWFMYDDDEVLIKVGLCQTNPAEFRYDARGQYCDSNDAVTMSLEVL